MANILKSKKIKVAMLILLIVVVFAGVVWYIDLPEYCINNSTVMSSNSGRVVETTLNIVVYKNHYDEKMYERIAEEYCEINGTPTELVMKLYYSKEQMKGVNGQYRTVVFDYLEGMKYILL
ncbi:MAG: hypothetical protein IJ439_02300 [Tyzzerella sp.]|nr:hypothetical protein [Tyzzerella sp.]